MSCSGLSGEWSFLLWIWDGGGFCQLTADGVVGTVVGEIITGMRLQTWDLKVLAVGAGAGS